MKRFEHMTHSLFGESDRHVKELNQLSDGGWELVAVVRSTAYLKRLCAADRNGQIIRPGDQVREGIILEEGTVMEIAERGGLLKLRVQFPNADGETVFESWIQIDFLEAIIG